MRVYLCGPMTGCSYALASEWRDEARFWLNRHGITALNPMDRDYRDEPLSHLPALVEEDKIAIELCDVLLVNFTEKSIGTSMEVLYGWEHGKRVIVVSEDFTEDPWLVYHSHNRYTNWEDAFKKIIELRLEAKTHN